MVVFAIINQSYSPETIVMVTDPAEVDHYKAEFMHGLDKTIFRENYYTLEGGEGLWILIWLKLKKLLKN